MVRGGKRSIGGGSGASRGFPATAASSAAPSAVGPSSPLPLPVIQGDAFRHPLDLENTQMLRALPGFDVIIRTMVSPVTEQLLVMENVGSGLLVSEKQYPSIYKLHREAQDILGIEDDVRVYVRSNPTPNAYTLAVAGGKEPFIVLHTALIELLTPRELQSVIAHELGHLKCDHGVYLAMANLLAASALALPMGVGNMISAAVEEGLYRWLRSAELSCDRAALVVARDPKVVASALMKLAGGVVGENENELNVDAFIHQASVLDEAHSSASPIAWYLRNAQLRQLSHPLPVLRAREVMEWSNSFQYKTLRNAADRRADASAWSAEEGDDNTKEEKATNDDDGDDDENGVDKR